ncbi:MAG TPA: UvrD-helicase domain-containing protein [Streptosporangiaceae bacterium]|nr:UvrD-helicase domain-containing protein [Streptosporangiaceae bacterium]
MFHADLHVHSRFSLACSKHCTIGNLAWWAARKGIRVVGTGDFTHPAWSAELRECLEPAEPGLLRLRPSLAAELRRTLAPSCHQEVRFLLSAEVSTIYKRDERTRKVHHLIYAPTFSAAEAITSALAKVGNLASDGRPILGLDSRHLLEITLNAGTGCFLVPAHIWTPWFGALGSWSRFDTVAECYGDLADQVFAVETGLSSDPAMNWMCSTLDRYRLVSNSDAHSPPMLGREATTFCTSLDYFAIAAALRTGVGLAGTINFFPEGGRYHLDGHRQCGVRFEPEQTANHEGRCPACGKPLTIGVAHRVAELADRPAGYRPPGAAEATNLVSLPEVLGEIRDCGPKSKKVTEDVDRLVAALGPELHILTQADVAEVSRVGGATLGEAVSRLRRAEVTRDPGYDGEYGVVRLFAPGELAGAGALFDIPAGSPAKTGAVRRPGARGVVAAPGVMANGGGHGSGRHTGPDDGQRAAADPGPVVTEDAAGPPDGLLAGLDPDQRAAATSPCPLLVVAGPGTGKTRTLTHRIAAAVAEGLAPESCLALTFTRRAAQEMRERLDVLVPAQAGRVTVSTFHGLGLTVLRSHAALAGLPDDFTMADDDTRLAVATEEAGSAAGGRRLLAEVAADAARRAEFAQALAARSMVDFDGLVELPVALLTQKPELAAELRERWQSVSVDEYQDIDASQYALLRLLAGDGSGLTVIGDPDQAIYGFRGGDVGFFLRFARDYPGAYSVSLTRNYRSSPAIVAAALQAVRPATLVPGRELRAVPAPHVTARGRAKESGTTAPAQVTVHEAADEYNEAEWTAAAIERLLGGSSLHALDTGRAEGHVGSRLSLADFAILYRTDAQAGPIGQALSRAGLPYQKRSHDLLARRSAVPEIVAEIRLAAMDGAAVGTVADRLAAVVQARAARGGPGAIDTLAAGEVLRPLAQRCGDDLARFVTEIGLGAEADALDPRADAITLLTLHAAKGLEFSVVFLAGCERGLLPLWLPGDGGPDPDEERRLLFVGITRARAHLFLTYARQRRRHGTTVDGGPSPFLASIEPTLLDRGAAARRRPAAKQLRLL